MARRCHIPFTYPAVEPCSFCTYFTGTVAWEPLIAGPRVVALLNVRQRSTGAVLVAPRRHLGRLADLDSLEVRDIGEVVRRVATALTLAFNPDGLHVWCGGGVLAGQSEPHAHFQVVPRYDGLDYSFASSHALSRTDRQERRQVAQQIRSALRSQVTGVPVS